jgi:hypothetical protein
MRAFGNFGALRQVSLLRELKYKDASCKPELVVNFEIVGQADAAGSGEVEALGLLLGVAAVSESDSGSEASG